MSENLGREMLFKAAVYSVKSLTQDNADLRTQLASAEKLADEWQAKCAELEKDKTRLDKLDAYKTGNYETPYWKIYALGPLESLRQAIDRAIG